MGLEIRGKRLFSCLGSQGPSLFGASFFSCPTPDPHGDGSLSAVKGVYDVKWSGGQPPMQGAAAGDEPLLITSPVA